MRKQVASFCAAAILAGCAHPPLPVAIDAKYVGNVQGEIKRQIGIYQRINQQIKEGTFTDPASVSATPFWCGTGKIGFQISSVKVELTTTSDLTTSANVGLTIPVTTVIKITPSGSHSQEVSNIQAVTYNIWPMAYDDQPTLKTVTYTQADLASAPIASFLMMLRTGMLQAAMKNQASLRPGAGTAAAMKSDPQGKGQKPNGPQACVLDYNPETSTTDPGDTYKVGLTVTVDDKLGATVDVGFLTLGGSNEDKTTSGNTLTISFREADMPPGAKPCSTNARKLCDINDTPVPDGVGITAHPGSLQTQ